MVAVCRAESCRTLGGEALLARARQRLGCSEQRPTSPDGGFTVEPAYCLGLCALSPALTINDRPHVRMTPGGLDALLDAELA
jgi:formate dehydrogenase subunit gamma